MRRILLVLPFVAAAMVGAAMVAYICWAIEKIDQAEDERAE